MAKFRYKTWNGETRWVTKRGLPTRREAVQWEEDFKLRKSGSINILLRDFVQDFYKDKGPHFRESIFAAKLNRSVRYCIEGSSS